MVSNIDLLDNIHVAAPCRASWDAMEGDERQRFCQQCRKNVYNLSDMTRKQAIALVQEKEGHNLCVRFYRRPDGTVLTDNCPVGLRGIRNTIVRRWAAVSALAAVLLPLTRLSFAGASPQSTTKKGNQAPTRSDDKARPTVGTPQQIVLKNRHLPPQSEKQSDKLPVSGKSSKETEKSPTPPSKQVPVEPGKDSKEKSPTIVKSGEGHTFMGSIGNVF